MRIDINGTAASVTHDLLQINGTLDVNSDAGTGGALEVDLGYDAALGDTFLFIENDGADLAAGAFENLAQAETLTVNRNGNLYDLEIDYLAGDGNDVSLTVTDIRVDEILI